MSPSDLVTQHFRLQPPQKAALHKLRIFTLRNLLYHFPARYERGGTNGTTQSLVPGTKVTLIGTLSKLEAKKLWKSRRPATEGWFSDGSGRVKVMWFNQPYMAKMAPQGVPVRLVGTVGGSADKPYLTNPDVVAVPPGEMASEGMFATTEKEAQGAPASVAVYPESRGITSLWFHHAIKKLIAAGVHQQLEDPLPADIRTRYHLPPLGDALHLIHLPEDEKHAQAARKRFSFEEILTLQIIQARARMVNRREHAYVIDGTHASDAFLASLTLTPTGAQRRAIADILRDFQSGSPMARLLEGDVGSGKTLVAAATTFAAVKSRPRNRSSGTLQVAYMAPTEILATQHFESFIEYFARLPAHVDSGQVTIGLITGSGCRKFPSKTTQHTWTNISRRQLLTWVKNGEIALLIGTHALVQKGVTFKHLAYTIVDEQHRFGTKQRHLLAQKGFAPHFLSMTATPIPRTLALTIYGDLDISILDEKPVGRAKIITSIVRPQERERAYARMRDELKQGRQAYVICPRIDEPDPDKLSALQAKSAKAEAERLKRDVFPSHRIGLLHGALKPDEKEAIMTAFEAHLIDILVATSVVEVGINVPNATVILIEGAERFGLAQLHQLRGRVQRSAHQPYCFLLPETRGDMAMRRLRALEKSDDGFQLAEADLATRGAGDLYGVRQWGVSDIGMEALQNPRLIQAAREEAITLVANDPDLVGHPALAQRTGDAGSGPHIE